MRKLCLHGAMALSVSLFSLVVAGCPPADNQTPDAGPVAPCADPTKLCPDPDTFDPGFTATAPNTPNTIQVTISGETLGENGLPFNPVTPGDPQFIDGWNVTFDKYIVVVGNITLAENATASAIWQEQGAVVAKKTGPFAIDVHRLVTTGANGLVGKDGEEPAGGILAFDKKDDGSAFDTNMLYAFSYDTLAATYPATNVNLSAEEVAIYDKMVTNHWDKFLEFEADYVGTETSLGATLDPDGSIQAHFDALPHHIHAVFGFNDGTHNQNCINTDNGDGNGDDIANRGVQTNTNGAVIAQLTFHSDHVFWDKQLIEGTPLRMDPLAAWADPATGELDENALFDKPLAITFSDGTPMPDRGELQNVPGGYTTDQANPAQIVYDLNGYPAANIAGLAAFLATTCQSQPHLNSDGLCYVVGQHSSDPFTHVVVAPAQ